MTNKLYKLLKKLENKLNTCPFIRIGNYRIYADEDGSNKFIAIENVKTHKYYASDLSKKYFERIETQRLILDAIDYVNSFLNN